MVLYSGKLQKKRQTEKEVGRQYQRGMDLASSHRAGENRTRWKEVVANSYVLPRRLSQVMGWNRIEWPQHGWTACMVDNPLTKANRLYLYRRTNLVLYTST